MNRLLLGLTALMANVLEEGQEKARERQESIPNDQAEGGTTQKLPGNKTLILHLPRKELSISCYFIHTQDVKKSLLT